MTNEQKQCLLKYLGYYDGGVDGIWGNLSVHATAGFQDDFGMEATGVFDEATEKMAKNAVAGLVESVPDPEPEAPHSFWDDIQYFKREEFRCRCGGKYCNGFPAEPEEKLVRMADRARAHFGVPAIVSSGVRCETHNRNVGGTAASRHMSGKAMDVRFTGISSSMALPYVQAQPECRYAYAIDGNYIHMDIL